MFAEMVWLPSSLDPVLHPEPFITLAESTKELGHAQNQALASKMSTTSFDGACSPSSGRLLEHR